MEIVIIQFALAIFLFFAVNWIGEHSASFGYLQLSIVPRRDHAPAFNWLLKTVAPTAYIILLATFCYLFRWDRILQHVWLVALFYFSFRLFYNILLDRALLLNWTSILAQMALGTGVSYLAYVHLILPGSPLLPSAEGIRDQLWIVMALFLYATLNNIQTSNAGSIRRKNRYLSSRFAELRKQYGNIVDGQFPERYMELVAYAILIYETFNRPRLARAIERVVFPWGSHTLGPMQVSTTDWLSDFDGVAVGMQRLRDSFAAAKEGTGKSVSRVQIIRMSLAKYNRDEFYITEIMEILYVLWARIATEYRSEFETMYDRVL